MKVVIITEGGQRIGLGHIARCSSLYEAFKAKGISPDFIINGDETARDILKNKKCQFFNWLKEHDKLFKFFKDIDIAIIDSYLAGLSFYKNVSRMARIPVYIDDNKRIDYPHGIVVNGSVYAKGLKYPGTKDKYYLLGVEYALVRKEFWRVPGKKIRKGIATVMITFGANDPRNMTEKTLEILVKGYPNLEKKVVLGRGLNNARKIKNMKDSNTELIYSPDAKKMKEIMLESDIAISAAGQTLCEFARVGVPVIAIAVADNQLNSIRGWHETGFIENCGWWEDKKILSRIEMGVRRLFIKEERLNKSAIGRKLVDGRGSLRIRDFLLKSLNNKLFDKDK